MKVRLPREQHPKVETKRGSRLPTEKKKNVAASGTTRPSNSIVRFVCGFTPVPLPDIKPDIEKPSPRMGPGIVGWSYDGQLMVSRFILLSIPTNCSIMIKLVHDQISTSFFLLVGSRNDNMPNGLWIWDTSRVALSFIIISMNSIRTAKWAPNENRLAWCSGTDKVILYCIRWHL